MRAVLVHLCYTLKRVPCTFYVSHSKLRTFVSRAFEFQERPEHPLDCAGASPTSFLCLSVLALPYNCFIPLLVLTYHPRPPVTEYLIFCISLPFVSVRSSKIHKLNTIVFFPTCLKRLPSNLITRITPLLAMPLLFPSLRPRFSSPCLCLCRAFLLFLQLCAS